MQGSSIIQTVLPSIKQLVTLHKLYYYNNVQTSNKTKPLKTVISLKLISHTN